jgi:hypothetical protein
MENTSLKLIAPWEEVKEHIKETNIELSDTDLDYKPGQEDQLLRHLSKKMGRTPQEVRAWIESISSNKGIAS